MTDPGPDSFLEVTHDSFQVTRNRFVELGEGM